MVYMGSKAKIAKYIVPILQESVNKNDGIFIDAFVGGCNIIEHIKAKQRVGIDIHKYLIALLNYVSEGNNLPFDTFSEEFYKEVKGNINKYPDYIVGLVGFCGSFGAKFMDTFARGKKNNGDLRDMPKERINNFKKQIPNLIGIKFFNCSYNQIPLTTTGATIYCDIPYINTADYKGSGDFDYNKFYEWCRLIGKNNEVFVSELNFPEEFSDIVWEGNRRSCINNTGSNKEDEVTEKLYKINIDKYVKGSGEK